MLILNLAASRTSLSWTRWKQGLRVFSKKLLDLEAEHLLVPSLPSCWGRGWARARALGKGKGPGTGFGAHEMAGSKKRRNLGVRRSDIINVWFFKSIVGLKIMLTVSAERERRLLLWWQKKSEGNSHCVPQKGGEKMDNFRSKIVYRQKFFLPYLHTWTSNSSKLDPQSRVRRCNFNSRAGEANRVSSFFSPFGRSTLEATVPSSIWRWNCGIGNRKTARGFSIATCDILLRFSFGIFLATCKLTKK